MSRDDLLLQTRRVSHTLPRDALQQAEKLLGNALRTAERATHPASKVLRDLECQAASAVGCLTGASYEALAFCRRAHPDLTAVLASSLCDWAIESLRVGLIQAADWVNQGKWFDAYRAVRHAVEYAQSNCVRARAAEVAA